MVEMNEDMAKSRQPNPNDPAEIRIRRVLENTLQTEWSKSVIEQCREEQIKFFREALGSLHNHNKILIKYRGLLKKIAELCKTKIGDGEQNIDAVASSKGIIIVTNHLGTAKLSRIQNFNREFKVDLDEFEPFPIRHAPFVKIADKYGFVLHETAIQMPKPLDRIQEACQVLTIPAEGSNRTQLLIDRVEHYLTKEKCAFVMYPEGGTSGKRNNAGPYDLDHFHSGAFVVAAYARLPILPVCQYFDPRYGFKLFILPAITITPKDLSEKDKLLETVRSNMQNRLSLASK